MCLKRKLQCNAGDLGDWRWGGPRWQAKRSCSQGSHLWPVSTGLMLGGSFWPKTSRAVEKGDSENSSERWLQNESTGWRPQSWWEWKASNGRERDFIEGTFQGMENKQGKVNNQEWHFSGDWEHDDTTGRNREIIRISGVQGKRCIQLA